ncbi:transposase [Azospirillaceae bacterium]
MDTISFLAKDWNAFVAQISRFIDLDATAASFKALQRRRGVKDASSLLRLGLGYGPCGLSLRQAAAWAEVTGVASLANTSLLDRLRNSSDWFAEIVRSLMSDRIKPTNSYYDGRTIKLIDGSSISEPGSKGTDWRLHAAYDLGSGQFSHIKVTDQHTAESLTHAPVQAGDILIADRGYAKAADLLAVNQQGGDFIVRIGWRSLRLLNCDGKVFDLFGKLSSDSGDGAVDVSVMIAPRKGRPALPVRLILLKKPDGATEQEQRRVERRSNRNQHQIDPRTLIAAGYVMIVTSLAADAFPAHEVAALYRLRWQIEIAFKRLKSILHIDRLRAYDPDLAKSWIYCHIIAALAIDRMSQEILESSP